MGGEKEMAIPSSSRLDPMTRRKVLRAARGCLSWGVRGRETPNHSVSEQLVETLLCIKLDELEDINQLDGLDPSPLLTSGLRQSVS